MAEPGTGNDASPVGAPGSEESAGEAEIDDGILHEEEQDKVRERLKLRAPAVYATVRAEGAAELERPSPGLFFSGIVAGIAMGFSVLTLSLLRGHLPDEPWAELVSSFGYAAGFLIVILGRQQLFTESTITAVLPVAAEPSKDGFKQIARVWSIVLGANWLGCILIGTGFMTFGLVPDDTAAQIVDFSMHLTDHTALDAFVLGIGGGFLIAAMVWMMPGAEGSEFAVVAFTAWLIALAGFTHVIASMVEITALVIEGHIGIGHAITTLTLPILAGNVLGGTLLFTVLAYAQVHHEVN